MSFCSIYDVFNFSKAKKGKATKDIKVVKTIRLDPEVVLWLETEGGEAWNGLSNFSELVFEEINGCSRKL